MLKNLLVHVSRYSLAGLAGTVAGFISFSVLTRMLSVSDYGLLSLILSTIYFIAAFGKAGLQFSIVRYFSDVQSGKSRWDLLTYYSTLILGMLSSGGIVVCLWASTIFLLPDHYWSDSQLKGLFLLTSVLVITEVLVAMLSAIMQARQQSGWLSIYRVSERYGVLLTVVIILYWVSQSLEGVFFARILAQVTAISLFAYFVLRGTSISVRKFSPKMLKEMMFYGIPLVASELAPVTLNLGDRYIIQWQMNSDHLGNYAAGYNLCEYVSMMLVVALFQAIRPMYFKLWNEQGPQATRAFIERSLYFYLMLCFPVIAGMAAIAPTLLTLVTSEKYAEGASTIPFIVAGLMIYGMHAMVGAGLYITKSFIFIWLTLIAAVVNIILSLLWVHEYGIVGVAAATLASYILLTFMQGVAGRSVLPISFPFWSALKFIGLSGIMYWAIIPIELNHSVVSVIAQVIAGGSVYAVLLFLSDKSARKAICQRFFKTGFNYQFKPRQFYKLTSIIILTTLVLVYLYQFKLKIQSNDDDNINTLFNITISLTKNR